MDDITRLPISDVIEPHILLRFVDKNSLEYMELRDSIREQGVFNSILVRPCKRAPGKYEVVDGMYRYTCSVDLRLADIPCIIKDMSDEEMLSIQIQANALRPETTPIEYARQLRRILVHHPNMPMRKLSVLVHKSPTWIKRMLNLLELPERLQKCVERGEIDVSKAYLLAKIPASFQSEFADKAVAMGIKEFEAETARFIKKYREQVRQGKLERHFLTAFEPVPYLRSLKTILDEYKVPSQAPLRIAVANCETPLDGWKLALQWVLNLDAEGVERQRLKAAEREKNRLLSSGGEACETDSSEQDSSDEC